MQKGISPTCGAYGVLIGLRIWADMMRDSVQVQSCGIRPDQSPFMRVPAFDHSPFKASTCDTARFNAARCLVLNENRKKGYIGNRQGKGLAYKAGHFIL